MIRRLWHFLFGHTWQERDVIFHPPTYPDRKFLTQKTDYHEAYGFTDITLICPCGSLKIHRLIGQHAPAGDPEVAEIRRMAGL